MIQDWDARGQCGSGGRAGVITGGFLGGGEEAESRVLAGKGDSKARLATVP